MSMPVQKPQLTRIPENVNLQQAFSKATEAKRTSTDVTTFKIKPDTSKLLALNGPVSKNGRGVTIKGAVPALIKRLGDIDWRVRADAALALGGIGTAAKAAVPALIKRLADNFFVKRAAALALGGIGPAAISALIKRLGDTNASVREDTAWALGYIGPAAKAAVPALIKRLGDSNPGVRSAAAKALGKIRGAKRK